MAIKLSSSTLDQLPEEVAVPSYDRSSLTPGIVHIGVGNFHRAHQAIYLDRLFALGEDHDWALIGSGILLFDDAQRSDLEKQDWLTTVVELDQTGISARICGSMIDYAPIGSVPLIEAMCRPEIRIVSLTVTEGGYFIDEKTGGLQKDHTDIVHDAAQPDGPKTVFGCIIAALRRRRDAGLAPFTVMSCDNLPENGHLTKTIVCGLASMIDPEQENWIRENVAFPNSMVDCITPATTDRERDLVREKFGIEDQRPVVCEPFRQWVLEDDFRNGRPALEKAGVEFVVDVAPYELMKLRILNGGHAILAYPSALFGLVYAHEAMAEPLIRDFLRKVLEDDVVPFVPGVPGMSAPEYLDLICRRFANPGVADTVERLCYDGYNRQPKFIVPSIKDNLAADRIPEGLVLSSAFWCHYCAGEDDLGNEIKANDPDWASLQNAARQALDNPGHWLAQTEIYASIGQNPELERAFASALSSIVENGTAQTIKAYLGT